MKNNKTIIKLFLLFSLIFSTSVFALSLSEGQWEYYDTTKLGGYKYTYNLKVTSGDCDFYGHHAGRPTKDSYHRRSNGNGNESFSFDSTKSSDYYIGVYAYSACSFSTPTVSAVSLTPSTPSTSNSSPSVSSLSGTIKSNGDLEVRFKGTDPEGSNVGANVYLSNANNTSSYQYSSKKSTGSFSSGSYRTITYSKSTLANLGITNGKYFKIRVNLYDDKSAEGIEYSGSITYSYIDNLEVEVFKNDFKTYDPLIKTILEQNQVTGLDYDTKVSRAEAVIMLEKFLSYKSSNFKNYDINEYYQPFADVRTGDYVPSLLKLTYYIGDNDNKTVINKANQLFRPLDKVSRQEFVAMVVQGLDLTYVDNMTQNRANLASFSDLNTVADWALKYFDIAVSSSLIAGNNGQLLPNDALSVYEAMVILKSAKKQFDGKYQHTEAKFESADSVDIDALLHKQIGVEYEPRYYESTATGVDITGISSSGSNLQTMCGVANNALVLTATTANNDTQFTSKISHYYWWHTNHGYFKKISGIDNFAKVCFYSATTKPSGKYKIVVQGGDNIGFVDKEALEFDGNFAYSTANEILAIDKNIIFTGANTIVANQTYSVNIAGNFEKKGIKIGIENIIVTLVDANNERTLVFKGQAIDNKATFIVPNDSNIYGQNVFLEIVAHTQNSKKLQTISNIKYLPQFIVQGKVYNVNSQYSVDYVTLGSQRAYLDKNNEFYIKLNSSNEISNLPVLVHSNDNVKNAFDELKLDLTYQSPSRFVVLIGKDKAPVTTPLHTLNIATPNNGLISCGVNSCNDSYNQGTTLILTATSNTGYQFNNWTGDCSGANPLTLTMTSDRTCSANFSSISITPTTYTLSVSTTNGSISSNPSGINCGSDCSATFNENTSVSLSATANSGYEFTGWGGDCSGATNPLHYTVIANAACSASFGIDTDNDGIVNSIDSDGDGMPDTWEIANNLNPLVDDANNDADNDGLTNLQEYAGGVNSTDPNTDNVAPVFASITKVTLSAKGRKTGFAISAFNVSATDKKEGEITPSIHSIDGKDAKVSSGKLILESGVHTLIWKATDTVDNIATATQTVDILPTANFATQQFTSEGQTATVRVFLSGVAPSYPVSIPFTISGDVDTDDYSVTSPIVINSAQEGSATVTIKSNADITNEAMILTMGDIPTGAVKGMRGTHQIIILGSSNNKAPKIKHFNVTQQDGTKGRMVELKDQTVTVEAEVFDPNDNNFTYKWSSDYLLSGIQTTNSVSFNPFDLSLDKGKSYPLTLLVTDDEGASVKRSIKVKIITLVVLNDSHDYDGDGIKDSVEGKSDKDGNGIPDYKEKPHHPHELGAKNGKQMSVPVGSKLLVGVMADDSAELTVDNIKNYRNQHGDSAFQADTYTSNHIYDYKIEDLTEAGETISVVLEIAPMLAGTVLRKYSLITNSWDDFKTDGNDKYYSATVAENASCPVVGSTDWGVENTLTENANCLQIVIEDGGNNDADGEANGSIDDPLALSTPNASPSSSGSSGGGGCVYNPNTPARFDMVFVLLTMLVGYYLVRRRRDIFDC